MPSVPKPTVVRDEAHLIFVRTLPCHFIERGDCNHWTTIGKGYSEASHLDGKSRDDRVLPMCGGHHRTNALAWHGGQRTFMAHYFVTKDGLIAAAEALYRDATGRT